MRAPYFHCRFELEGLNLERFLRLLADADISLYLAKRTGTRRMVCECHEADLPTIRALIAEKGWRLASVTPIRLAAVRRLLRRQWGIPVGCALMLAVVIALFQFVWRVEVLGAGAYRGELLAYLRERSIAVPTAKAALSPAALEAELYRRYPKIAWFSVYVHDVTLTVECAQGVFPPDEAGAGSLDVVASRDGIVDTITVFAGTATVRKGELVRKGQVLIQGVERAADEQTVPIRAEGRVLARCWHSSEATVSTRVTNSERTGRSSEIVSVCAPWFSLVVRGEAPAYLASETERAVTPVVGAYFPLWLQRDVLHELALAYAERDRAEVEQEAAEAAKRKLALAIGSDQIVDKWVDYCMIERNTLTARATAEIIVDIAAYAPP